MGSVRIGGHTIATSSEQRVVFPRDGVTKGDAIEYYSRVAFVMLPHIRKRLLTMQRFPDGIDGAPAFQKNISPWFPKWVERVTVPKAGGTVTHVVCNNAATLVYLANQNCLTPHVGLARIDDINCPDQMIFDLDPPEDDFEMVRTVAWSMKELLDELGLASFLKTTGSRGLHVVVPLDRKWNFDQVRDFARRVAEVIVGQRPGDVTIEMLKRNRGGRLFLDVNRNGTAQTAVPAFAIRARDRAPVAMPISWDELRDPKLNARSFTVANAVERVKNWDDPWRGMSKKAKSLRVAEARLGVLAPE